MVGKGQGHLVLQIQACKCLNLQSREWLTRAERPGFAGVAGGWAGWESLIQAHEHAQICRTEGVGGWTRARSLRFANSNTHMLKLVEPRVAGGWPRSERLGFIIY